jgi:hypothetical protein
MAAVMPRFKRGIQQYEALMMNAEPAEYWDRPVKAAR